MAVTLNDINKIAHLARLGLIDDLQAVNTQGIEPLAHAVDVTQPLRPDVVTESNQRDAYQQVAPAVQDGLYLVPKVIE